MKNIFADMLKISGVLYFLHCLLYLFLVLGLFAGLSSLYMKNSLSKAFWCAQTKSVCRTTLGSTATWEQPCVKQISNQCLHYQTSEEL